MNLHRILRTGVALAGIAIVSACATKAPPPPPPPPVVMIPPRPVPPLGAQANFVTPPVDASGVRQTINTGITPAQATWNLRSAYNVAALNCLQPQHAQIVGSYRQFLKDHQRKLTSVNRTVDSEFKAKHGSAFVRPREAYMTQVYNYFALPITLPRFCDAALAMSAEAATVKSADLEAFATRALPQLDQVFDGFFREYDAYRLALAAWEARYGATAHSTTGTLAPASQPGMVAANPPISAPPLVLPPVGKPAANPAANVFGPALSQ